MNSTEATATTTATPTMPTAVPANSGTTTTSGPNHLNWFDVEPREDSWLVDGLIPSDGHTALVGKAKTGKSSAARCLIACVLKNQKFLGRSINLPTGSGKVLYVHLDRKDILWRVTQELKDVHKISRQEAERLFLKVAEELPAGYENRLKWLQAEVAAVEPHLIVIDLMFQFAEVKNANDYVQVLTCINQLQDALSSIKYKGALVVTLHARKATNPEDEADDVIGSSAQRGSFVTGIYLSRNRNAGYYTIMSDQTVKDSFWGEIDKAVLIRNPDGSLTLGHRVIELQQQENKENKEQSLQRLLNFINEHPGCEITELVGQLSMSKKTVIDLLRNDGGELVRTEGKGVKNDPLKYFLKTLRQTVSGDGSAVGSQAVEELMHSKWVN